MKFASHDCRKLLLILIVGGLVSPVTATEYPSCSITPTQLAGVVQGELKITMPKEISDIIIHHLQPPSIRFCVYQLACLQPPSNSEQQGEESTQATLPFLVPMTRIPLLVPKRKKYQHIIDVSIYFKEQAHGGDTKYGYICSQLINVPRSISQTVSYDQHTRDTNQQQQQKYAMRVIKKYFRWKNFKRLKEKTTSNGTMCYQLENVIQTGKYSEFDNMRNLNRYRFPVQFTALNYPVIGQLNCTIQHFSFYHLLIRRIWLRAGKIKYDYYAECWRPLSFPFIPNVITIQQLNFMLTYTCIFQPFPYLLIYKNKYLKNYFRNWPVLQRLYMLFASSALFSNVLSSYQTAVRRGYPGHFIDGAFVPAKILWMSLYTFFELVAERLR